jgi:uncharacterized protein (DUF2384 family)
MSHNDDQAETPSSDDDQVPGPTADEIGEQVVGSYFAQTWGARPLNAASLELNDFERLHRSPNTIYVGGLVKVTDITETLIPRREQESQLTRIKIPAEVLRRRDEIRLLAVKVLGSPREAEYWLERPIRFALEGRRPAELLNTLEGCDKVEQLLKNLYS